MRNVFFKLLHERMHVDEDLFLIVADVGLGLVDPIKNDFPERFLNVGIAEQNMIGIAAGLCNTRYRPVCYTLSNFLIHRCYEQIRNDVCLHQYPITLVGTSTGFDNGILGPTHHVIDDIGCLKVLPYMRIYSPGSNEAIKNVFHDVFNFTYPSYVRIGKGSIQDKTDGIKLNQMIKHRPESPLVVITHGNMLDNCIKASDISSQFSLYCMNKIKPLNDDDLKHLFSMYRKVLIVEDHMKESGLYNSLCQYVIESELSGVHLFVQAPDNCYEGRIGNKDYFSSLYGLSPEKIVTRVKKILDS